MALANISAAISALRKLSEDNGNISLEQTAGIVEGWEKLRTTEQLTSSEKKDARTVYEPQIVAMFEANPNADLDPAEIVSRIGMPDKQGARSFVRFKIRQLRLTYQGDQKIAAD